MHRRPAVTVAICLFNSSRFIDETLESVFAQNCIGGGSPQASLTTGQRAAMRVRAAFGNWGSQKNEVTTS